MKSLKIISKLLFFFLISDKCPLFKELSKWQIGTEIRQLWWLTNLLGKSPCHATLEGWDHFSLIRDPHLGRKQYINSTWPGVQCMNNTGIVLPCEGFEPLPSSCTQVSYDWAIQWLTICKLVIIFFKTQYQLSILWIIHV